MVLLFSDGAKVYAQGVTTHDDAVANEMKATEGKDSVMVDEFGDAVAVSDPLDKPFITKKDSVALEKIKKKRDWTTWKPDPKKAMWLAIVLPGAGQIYNRKYWKLPIVYGGFLGCAYAMRWNNQMYQDYSQAYLDIMDDDPNTKSYMQFIKVQRELTSSDIDRYKNVFKSRKDKYRRWRDLSFFCMLGVYALSIIDAYVDAQLSQFDISDDLSLRIEPAVINGNTHSLSNRATPANIDINTSAIGFHGALVF